MKLNSSKNERDFHLMCMSAAVCLLIFLASVCLNCISIASNLIQASQLLLDASVSPLIHTQ